ncbi:alkaline phosphatase family protein [Janthinobacterium agaricidamnosum]|uniref:Phosphoesterase family protein n=1 Tax=Janthinobacterium agaricidamnosum NBRC 102515 = DSM 9628 TaxID=1349767 RepID=W0VBS4_9BURK|nr:alkaline phosphatase family protein [Janthinobacterium agaricidamnosum]CDG84747.1 phosphoesterase family protein [Janthinobacterium agaricidamnosum NBRC 102515 = DSM 9628]
MNIGTAVSSESSDGAGELSQRAAIGLAAAIANLDKIKHIVVLMMENRSFDHMLGYLSLEGGRGDIDGLQAGFMNSHAGRDYPVHHLARTAFRPDQDPGHGGASVARQLSNGNGGFIDDYLLTHPGDADFPLVMGYYNAADLPVYDFLAQQFCVCDRWYSSVPGATWPNRLYAISGKAAGSKDSKRVPLYANKSFVRHLDSACVSWKFYSFWKPWSLALTDDHYRTSEHYEPFGSSQRRYGFIGDALAGTLPAVSWIDPHFFENDDHPPADVRAGQALAAQVYQALSNGPGWNDTLLILCYDEHGGFYDHVAPGAAIDADPAFRQYGVRVPAFAISPWVAASSVHHGVLDHSAIIKTILLRFCRSMEGTIPDMGPRVGAAAHLGPLLSEAQPRSLPALPEAALLASAAWESGMHAVTAQSMTMMLSAEEAGAIAAEKQIAKVARHTKPPGDKPATIPLAIGKRRRKRGKLDAPAPRG